jgi:hypothetical protein
MLKRLLAHSGLKFLIKIIPIIVHKDTKEDRNNIPFFSLNLNSFIGESIPKRGDLISQLFIQAL